MNAATKPIRFDAPEEATAEIGFAPLVDVVLLLICFYIFVTGTVQSYDAPPIALPQIQSTLATEEHPFDLVVNITEEGLIIANGKTVDFTQLGSMMRKSAGDGSTAITIRIDRTQPFAELDKVLKMARETGLQQALIRSTRGGGQ